jgi:hypothetical protein
MASDREKNYRGVAVVERAHRILRDLEGGDLHAKLHESCFDELPQLGVIIDDERKMRIDGNPTRHCRTHAEYSNL